MGSEHHLTKINISPRVNENLSKGSGDMERTGNSRVNTMTLSLCRRVKGSA